MDYLVLVNQLHAMPKDWYEDLKTDRFINTAGEEVEIESRTFQAYTELKKELKEKGIEIDADSGLRSMELQQQIMDDFTKEFGAGYAAKTVAPAGYSEHQTGLAVDLYPIIDGQNVMSNAELLKHPELWEVIHACLAGHGFILRYPEGKEHVTGYGYEPWHVRFINDPAEAGFIMAEGLTLEEYLLGRQQPDVMSAPGVSALYSREEQQEMSVLIKCSFASRAGIRLQQIRYKGDEAVRQLSVPGYQSLAVFAAEYITAGSCESEDFLLGYSPYGWEIISQE